MSRTGSVVVGSVDELPRGAAKIVPVGKFGVGVFNVNGNYFALANYCPHRGAPVCQGVVTGTAVQGSERYAIEWTRDGDVLRCPWHGWEFSIEDGEALVNQTASRRYSIRTYPVTVEDGLVILSGV